MLAVKTLCKINIYLPKFLFDVNKYFSIGSKLRILQI
jgi:hypothetical protein